MTHLLFWGGLTRCLFLDKLCLEVKYRGRAFVFKSRGLNGKRFSLSLQENKGLDPETGTGATGPGSKLFKKLGS